MAYQDLMNNVRRLLREAITARYVGGPHTRKVQAQAYADGYMRALADADLVDDAQLLDMVMSERMRDADEAALGTPKLAIVG